MSNFSLEVVALTKRTINHIELAKKQKKLSFGYVFVFLFVNIIAFSAVHFVKDYNNSVANTSFYSQHNSKSILTDLKNVVFASADSSEFNNEESPNELMIPVATKEFSIDENGVISFVVDENIMVVASAKGIIIDSGILTTGGKFIEIKHSKNLSTKYENIEIAGVVRGDVVKEGQDVGTAKTGEVIRFSVLYDGAPITDLVVENNVVIWQEQNKEQS